MKKNKGITLIALVVTIIVLLILAGISIATLTGTNGIITRANEARDENVKGTEREQISLAYSTEKSILLEQGNTEAVKAEALESRLKLDGANVMSVEKEDENLKVTFNTKNFYYVDNDGNITDGTPPEPPVLGELEKPTEEILTQFNKTYGIIEIAWLDRNNNVIKSPLKITQTDIDGMTPVKWDGTPGSYEEKETTVTDNSWYQYIAQPGNTETEGSSRWANAKATSGRNVAYFVWIPRYSYKIIYFDNETNKENYRADNTNQTGIIGYSTRHGMIDVTTGIPKIVEGTEPVNITGTVKTAGYQDYIPHPAFEFDGVLKGIWVGKYEASGSISTVTIKPSITSLRYQTLDSLFLASQGVKETYGLSETTNTHMMKNIEWGAAAYLTESKYGRNGTEIIINSQISNITGHAKDYTSNYSTFAYNTAGGILASTTGNIYGIYDMSGGANEYVAGYINNSYAQSSNDIASLRNAAAENPKYADIYDYDETKDSKANNYSLNKNKYGDGIYETSTSGSTYYAPSWHSDWAHFVYDTNPVLQRGGVRHDVGLSGVFYFNNSAGRGSDASSFRVVLTKTI